MRSIKDVKIAESISKGRLVYTASASDKVLRTMSYLMCLVAAAFMGLIAYYGFTSGNSNDNMFAFVGAVFILVCAYVFWRVAGETRLQKIVTTFSEQEIMQRLLQFAAVKNYDIVRRSGGYFIFNESNDFFGSATTYSIVLIPRQNILYFTVLTERPRANIPSFTNHLILKRHLKRLLAP